MGRETKRKTMPSLESNLVHPDWNLTLSLTNTLSSLTKERENGTKQKFIVTAVWEINTKGFRWEYRLIQRVWEN
jgi:hypothetical protein